MAVLSINLCPQDNIEVAHSTVGLVAVFVNDMIKRIVHLFLLVGRTERTNHDFAKQRPCTAVIADQVL